MLRRFFQLPFFIRIFKALRIYAACNEDFIERLMKEFEFTCPVKMREFLLKDREIRKQERENRTKNG